MAQDSHAGPVQGLTERCVNGHPLSGVSPEPGTVGTADQQTIGAGPELRPHEATVQRAGYEITGARLRGFGELDCRLRVLAELPGALDIFAFGGWSAVGGHIRHLGALLMGARPQRFWTVANMRSLGRAGNFIPHCWIVR